MGGMVSSGPLSAFEAGMCGGWWSVGSVAVHDVRVVAVGAGASR